MNELLNCTMAEAVEKLAVYAVALKSAPAEKRAAGDFLSSLGTAFKENPTLGSALAGGGIGAAVGGVSTAMGNRGKEEGQKKGLLGSMMTGGLAGAGIGAGASMAHKGLSNLTGEGNMGHDALRPGEFTIKGPDGQPMKMRIDPKALKNNPDLHKQVKSLTTPSFQSSLAGGAGGLWDQVQKAVPTSAAVLPWAAGADALWHGAGLGSVNAGQASGAAGKELFRNGLSQLKDTPEHIQKAMNSPLGGVKPEIDQATGGWKPGNHTSLADNKNPGGWLGRQVDKVRANTPYGLLGRPNPPRLSDILGGRSGTEGGSRTVASVDYTPIEEREVTKGKGTDQEVKTKEKFVMPKKTETINEGMIADAKREGAKEHPYYKGRRLYRGPLGTYSGAASYAGGAGRRAMVAAPLVAGEYLARGMGEDVQNKQTLRDLMQQHAKPVPEGQ